MITPFIMCGGTGTRLWPVSRASMPKQFQAFFGERTLLQDTAVRVTGPGFAP
ncbi:mannose-1-phosphate guanylyltransferase, partial [Micromonospora sp. STR1s_5]|nr:mannose-1-phosphate guanylyltransferase [Micromonospora sp. STR1s_5]